MNNFVVRWEQPSTFEGSRFWELKEEAFDMQEDALRFANQLSIDYSPITVSEERIVYER